MKLKVSHLTRYEYAREVSFSPHLLCLRPREHASLEIAGFRLEISPDYKLVWTRDHHDNLVAWAHFWERSATLSILCEFEAETSGANPFDFVLKPYALNMPFEYEAVQKNALAPFLAKPSAENSAAIDNWLSEHFVDRPCETVPWLVALNRLVHGSLSYRRRMEHGIQSPAATLRLGSGSCRDYAVLFVDICRGQGVAARFVSGYLHDPEPGSPAHGAMHAWAEVYLPGAGWKGIDPTHGFFCDEAFVPVAHAAVAESVSPIQGSYYAPEDVPSRLSHTITVEKIP